MWGFRGEGREYPSPWRFGAVLAVDAELVVEAGPGGVGIRQN